MSGNQGNAGDPSRITHLVSFRERQDDVGVGHHLEVFLLRNRQSGLLELPGRAAARRRPRVEQMAKTLLGAEIEQFNPYPRQVVVLYDEDTESSQGFTAHDVYAVKFKTEPIRGQWVDLMDLPEDIDPRHRPMIEAALRVFTHEVHRIVSLSFWGVATPAEAASWQRGVEFDTDLLEAWRRPGYLDMVWARREFYFPHEFWQESIRRVVVFWTMQFAQEEA